MNDTIGRAQNWCLDPYGTHEARWFSRGIPTALVRDRGVETQDPPPDSAFAHRYAVLGYGDPWRLGGADRRTTVPPAAVDARRQASTSSLTASMS